jgi:predicted bacteriocin transport accessory protein
MKDKKILIMIVIAVMAIILSFVLSEIKKEPIKNEKKVKIASDSKVGLVDININKYFEYLNSDEARIVLISRPTCPYCQKFTPILKELTEQYKFAIFSLNTDTLTESDWNKFVASNEYFSGQWGTPLVLVVSNGKIIDKHEGYAEKEVVENYFRDIKVIK